MTHTHRQFNSWKRKRILLLEQEIKTLQADPHQQARTESLQLQIEETRAFSFTQWRIDQRQMEFDFPAS